MAQKNAAKLTEVLRVLAQEFHVPEDVDVDALAQQLIVDMKLNQKPKLATVTRIVPVKPGQRGGRRTAKLTPRKVRNIRKAVEGGAKQADIAKKYRISSGAVSQIVNRKAWVDVA